MVGAFGGRGIGEHADQIGTVAGEEWEDRVEAFLQVAVGEQEIREVAGFGAGALITAEGFALDFAADFFELVNHFRFAFQERGDQCVVEPFELVMEAIEVVSEAVVSVGEGSLDCGGDEGARDPFVQVLRIDEGLGERQMISIEQFFGARFEQREGCSRHHDGHAAEQAVIDDLGLREVCELGGSADVGDGGEEVILNDGPEQGVGGDLSGSIAERGEIRIGAPQRDAFPIFEQEKERRFFFEVNLGVISGGFELAIAFEQF